MKKILCLTNVGIDDVGGRSRALRTRLDLLEKHDWEVEIFLIKRYYQSLTKIFDFKRKILDFEIVWSMNNPLTLHLPPLLLKRLGYNFKWIAEFRDPIYYNPDIKNNFVRELYGRIEFEIVRYSDLIVLTKGLQVSHIFFAKRYGTDVLEKIRVLPYAGIETTDLVSSSKKSKKDVRFTILYAGSFYKDWIEPITFFKSLYHFIKKLNLSEKDIKVIFYGDWDPKYTDTVSKLSISKFIEYKGWVKKEDLMPIMQNADLLLYIGGNKYINRKNISMKIWDYMSTGNPILALCKPYYELWQFIKCNNLGLVADYDDYLDISSKLELAYKMHENNQLKKLKKKILRNKMRYTRYNHDKNFVMICEELYNRICG